MVMEGGACPPGPMSLYRGSMFWWVGFLYSGSGMESGVMCLVVLAAGI
jgi:hypothetical protein